LAQEEEQLVLRGERDFHSLILQRVYSATGPMEKKEKKKKSERKRHRLKLYCVAAYVLFTSLNGKHYGNKIERTTHDRMRSFNQFNNAISASFSVFKFITGVN